MKRYNSIELLYPPLANKIPQIQDEFYRKTGTNLVVLESLRTGMRQDYLYSMGRTLQGSVITNAQAYQSLHQYGLAVDFIVDISPGIPGVQGPYSADADYHYLFELCRDYDLISGASWGDLGHVEVKTDFSVNHLKKILFSSNKYGIQSIFESVKMEKEVII